MPEKTLFSRFARLLPPLFFLLAAGGATLGAEHIRLSNGQYLQAVVLEATDEGVRLRLIAGGETFFRWTQIHADDAARLRDVKSPDSAVNLDVRVKGGILELANGDVIEGLIREDGDAYLVSNLAGKDRRVPRADVAEYIPDVMIDASVVMKPEEILAYRQQEQPPLSAEDHYGLARLAEHLGLFKEARALLDTALGLAPDDALKQEVEARAATLDEILKEQALLVAITGARDFSRKREFQNALAAIDFALKGAAPSGPVATKLKETRDGVEQEYQKFIVEQWYRLMFTNAARNTKKMTVQEAMAYARSQLEQDIIADLSKVTKGGAKDIRDRFAKRDLAKLPLQNVRIGMDGWYDVIGGPLPTAGNKTRDSAGRSGRGGPGGGGDGDGFDDAWDPASPQRQTGASGEEMEEYLKKLREGKAEGAPDGGRGGIAPGAPIRPRYKPDDPKLRVPPNTPSLVEWWASKPSARRAWTIAFYVRNVRTVVLIEERYDTFYYK